MGTPTASTGSVRPALKMFSFLSLLAQLFLLKATWGNDAKWQQQERGVWRQRKIQKQDDDQREMLEAGRECRRDGQWQTCAKYLFQKSTGQWAIGNNKAVEFFCKKLADVSKAVIVTLPCQEEILKDKPGLHHQQLETNILSKCTKFS